MSLLNDVLKDLDKLKRQPKTILPVRHRQAKTFLQSCPPFSVWLLMPFICCGLFLWAIIHLQPDYRNATTLSTQSEISSQAEATTSTIPSVPIVPTTLAQLSQTPPNGLDQGLSSQLPSLMSQAQITFPQVERFDASIEPIITEPEPAVTKVFNALTEQEWHDQQLNSALEAIQQGNEDIAEQDLTQLLAKLPNAIVARETLATLYLAQENYAAAQTIIDDGLQLAPNALSLNTLNARLLFEQNHPQQALSILKHFRPNIYTNPDFYGLMAAILQSLDQFDASDNLYQTLVKIEPNNGQYWLGHAIALEHKHQIAQAISAYTKATEPYDTEPAIRTYAENRLKTLQG